MAQTDDDKAKAAAEKAAKDAEAARIAKEEDDRRIAEKRAAERAQAEADELTRLREEVVRLSATRAADLDLDTEEDDEVAPAGPQRRAPKVAGLITVDHTGKEVG